MSASSAKTATSSSYWGACGRRSGAALISGADATTWAEYGALGDEWSTKGVGIL